MKRPDFLIIFFVGTLFSLNSFAVNQALVKQFEVEKNHYLQKDEKKRNILGDLYTIKTKMKRIDREKTALGVKYDKAVSKLDSLNQHLSELEEKTNAQKREMRRQLDFMVKFQDTGLIKLIFSSQTPVELDRNLRLLKNLTEKDFFVLKNYFRNIREITVKRDEVKKEEVALSKLKTEITEQEGLLTKTEQKKTQILSEIQTQNAIALLKMKKIRANSISDSQKKQNHFIDTILKPLVFESRGALEQPVEGPIVQGYGYMLDPIYKTKLRHKGIFFKTQPHTNVSSIYDGEVEYADLVAGFGKTVVISHGDHYYSVYSYLDEILVKTGEDVKKDQVVAKTGGEHPFFGDGLYFEMRHFSEPINPSEWFKKDSHEIN